ncbi:unnamed protein product [Soboliphyme baturini]|uniref:DUF229 domain-containing protein n=1 Tax=Soboliphyme baturini TaxID=241478 RepID=A0A183IL48_9BILA|nr:unnamed protein product [Soboliphyme baturini]
MSRMMFKGRLKRTYKFLTDDLKAIVLEGYSTVSEEAEKALTALLTGSQNSELFKNRKGPLNASVDARRYVWNDFMDIGYITFYGEDFADCGAFKMPLRGFFEQPTDHYRRISCRMEKSGQHITNRHLCIGSDPDQKTHFAYFQNFVTSYLNEKDTRVFAISLHSVLSTGSRENDELADDDAVQLLMLLLRNGWLENSVLMFMATDHGQSMAEYGRTEQGTVDEHQAFFGIYVPSIFKSKYPDAVQNLLLNVHRLTTPFDIYATLRHMINFTTPKFGDLSQKGISLFDEVPKERSCADAGIKAHFCPAVRWSNVPVDDAVVKRVAAAIVNKVNGRTAKERALCAELSLSRIIRASEATVRVREVATKVEEMPDPIGTARALDKLYKVHIVTDPGDARYEASVVVRDVNKVLVDLDSVSRINLYKDIPHCLIDLMDGDVYLAK